MVYVTRFNRTILALGAKRERTPPLNTLKGRASLSQGWIPTSMCRCLTSAVRFWVEWSSWLVRLVVVSWFVTWVSNALLSLFWSYLTDLLRGFLTSFWASRESGDSHAVGL